LLLEADLGQVLARHFQRPRGCKRPWLGKLLGSVCAKDVLLLRVGKGMERTSTHVLKVFNGSFCAQGVLLLWVGRGMEGIDTQVLLTLDF